MFKGCWKHEHMPLLFQNYDMAGIMYEGGVVASFSFWQKKVIKLCVTGDTFSDMLIQRTCL
jgi:hypothetical protein